MKASIKKNYRKKFRISASLSCWCLKAAASKPTTFQVLQWKRYYSWNIHCYHWRQFLLERKEKRPIGLTLSKRTGAHDQHLLTFYSRFTRGEEADCKSATTNQTFSNLPAFTVLRNQQCHHIKKEMTVFCTQWTWSSNNAIHLLTVKGHFIMTSSYIQLTALNASTQSKSQVALVNSRPSLLGQHTWKKHPISSSNTEAGGSLTSNQHTVFL